MSKIKLCSCMHTTHTIQSFSFWKMRVLLIEVISPRSSLFLEIESTNGLSFLVFCKTKELKSFSLFHSNASSVSYIKDQTRCSMTISLASHWLPFFHLSKFLLSHFLHWPLSKYSLCLSCILHEFCLLLHVFCPAANNTERLGRFKSWFVYYKTVTIFIYIFFFFFFLSLFSCHLVTYEPNPKGTPWHKRPNPLQFQFSYQNYLELHPIWKVKAPEISTMVLELTLQIKNHRLRGRMQLILHAITP